MQQGVARGGSVGKITKHKILVFPASEVTMRTREPSPRKVFYTFRTAFGSSIRVGRRGNGVYLCHNSHALLVLQVSTEYTVFKLLAGDSTSLLEIFKKKLSVAMKWAAAPSTHGPTPTPRYGCAGSLVGIVLVSCAFYDPFVHVQ